MNHPSNHEMTNGHSENQQNPEQARPQEPDSTTSGYPGELESLIINSLRGNSNSTADGGNSNSNNGNVNGENSSGNANGATTTEQSAETLLSQMENMDEINRLIEEAEGADGENHEYELPRSLIVTNMDHRIFVEGTPERAQFEATFRVVDQSAIFLYFKSFRRARVDFAVSIAATKARILCNQRRIGDETINCYYAEVCEMVSNMLLRPPALEKQFLISPPASPPEGWEPVEEAQPVLNFDLHSALANLMPGTTHELHAGTENQPGIFVHIAPDTTTSGGAVGAEGNSNGVGPHEAEEAPVSGVVVIEAADDSDGDDMMGSGGRGSLSGIAGGLRKIQQTACPPSMSSAAAAAAAAAGVKN